MSAEQVKIPTFKNDHFAGPSLPFDLNWGPRMNVVDGGQSAILFGYGNYTNPTPIFKLFCDSNDASHCKWKQLEFSLPFNALLPVSIMIPDEIVPDCK